MALSAALTSVSPWIFEASSNDDLRMGDEVIEEVRQQLKILDTDQSEIAFARIKAVLDKEVERRLTDGTDLQAVENKLGEEGRLPNGAYRVNAALNTEYGARESERFAKRLIERATLVDHIYAGDGAERQNSFFARQVTDTLRREPYWVVAIAQRLGADLNVNEIYRLFPETVKDPVNPRSAFEVLSALLLTYGLPTRANGIDVPNRLIFDYELGSGPGIETYDAPPSTRVTLSTIVAGLPDKPRFALAYAIMPDLYDRDWIRLMKGVRN